MDARVDLNKNVDIDILLTQYALLTSEEELFLEKKKSDFSIMKYGLNKCILLLGPVALVNHDCSANCSYKRNKDGKICITTKCKIKKDEELTCFYSKNYFGDSNKYCQCKTCESDSRGAYQETNEKVQVTMLLKSNNIK